MLVGCSASPGGTTEETPVDSGPGAGKHDASGPGVHPGGDDASTTVDGSGPPPDGPDATVTDTGSPQGAHNPPDAGYVDRGANPSTVLIRVANGCPVHLWINAAAKESTLSPDYVDLAPGGIQDYDAPFTWTSGRVNAFLTAPDSSGNEQGESDKVEVNISSAGGSASLNTDITYVDWIAIPSRIEAFGSGSDCTTVGCDATYAHVLDGCPASLFSGGHECLSAGYYCLTTPNKSDPYCHALDAQVTSCAQQYGDCAGATGSSTTEVYSCSGSFFGNNPQYCAAINRGVLASPGASTPASAFYQNPPFNTYAKWVHETCPGIYAFPYDDFGSSNQSSDHTCTGATQLSVTFCPKG
jgi:hypothetical protein